MASTTDLHILLLAAGEASRYGSAKQALSIDGVPMVRRAAQAALATGAELTVVTGAHAAKVIEALAGLPLTLLHNDLWAEGMGESIGCGFRHLIGNTAGSAATIIALADQPQVDAAALQALIEAHRHAPTRIIAADHGSTRGPPCLFPAAHYSELAALSGAQGARKLLERHAALVTALAMPAAAIDIDTPEDYRRWRGSTPD
ncbi:MAG TPA: nucleotidyltransferase family protein [Solimonas sp.]|nr:nucleotidyltransferase family protein [Solimonas sp.]